VTQSTRAAQTSESAVVAPHRYVRMATAVEAAEALEIVQSAAAWSERFGAAIWDPASFTLAEQRQLAEAGELVGGFEAGRMVACMRLQPLDPVVWPDDRVGEALYIHKLAVLREAAGTGWTSRMIDFALGTSIASGVVALRLDTLPRARMIALYSALGFSTVDASPGLFGNRLLVRMERLVGDLSTQKRK
jgi:ribosomal protein S18 acetylase RimI-like enzyme